MASRVCAWLVVNFEARSADPRELISVEYDGLRLFIKPSPPNSEWADKIAVFMDRPAEIDEYLLKVNRFLSAMSWRDRIGYATLGEGSSGARCDNPGEPRFALEVPREKRGVINGAFYFEHLVVASTDEQRLALALYRDALCSDNPFYRFLSLFKIINVRYSDGTSQKTWISGVLAQVGNRVYGSRRRLDELLSGGAEDIGAYLYHQNRCAIAHAALASGDPIRDPDQPRDRREILRDMDLMHELAEIFIEQELGVPSVSTIWRQHLYELAGFKVLLGADLATRLTAGGDVPVTELPAIPLLRIGLRDKPDYPIFARLQFVVRESRAGRVLLVSEADPLQVILLLDFPNERLTLALDGLALDRGRPTYSRNLEVSLWQFLMDYFANGYLEVRNATDGHRLSYKTAFLPENIDPRATLEGFQTRIDRLLAEPPGND